MGSCVLSRHTDIHTDHAWRECCLAGKRVVLYLGISLQVYVHNKVSPIPTRMI